MIIPYNKKAANLRGVISKHLKENEILFGDFGETNIELERDKSGYAGEVKVFIEPDKENGFKVVSGWSGKVASRFPARIKAAATALKDNGYTGQYLIKHSEGLLSIKELAKELSPVELELERRMEMWRVLQDSSLITPGRLRELRIYGGAQGIFVDKKTTVSVDGNFGVAVGVMHTGRHYADDLEEGGIIYHYPKTNRSVSRDRGEIEATKAAKENNLPVFIIIKEEKNPKKIQAVKMGWVQDWDDQEQLFLIEFGDAKPSYEVPLEQDAPFDLEGEISARYGRTKQRPNQQKFRFNLFKQYGAKCGVCKVTNENLLVAAHIFPKEKHGSDDWRNGLVLCANHHNAFDSYLFGINETTHLIEMQAGVSEQQIGITEEKLTTLSGKVPHRDSLTWKHQKFFTQNN
jgi:ribosomal protein L25 (general stress protein Ctc)